MSNKPQITDVWNITISKTIIPAKIKTCMEKSSRKNYKQTKWCGERDFHYNLPVKYL